MHSGCPGCTAHTGWGMSSGMRWQLRCSDTITHSEAAVDGTPVAAIWYSAHEEYEVEIK